MNAGYRKRVVALLFVLLLSRFWFSQTFELTGAEAYSWMKGHLLDWGYWDQGPLVPWCSWLGTLLYRQTELGVRWMSANVYALVGFTLFYVGRKWFNPRVAFYSLCLYIILPIYAWQMLLMSEATLSVGLMALALIVFRQMVQRDLWWDWLLGGLVIALATMLDWWNLLWALGVMLFYLLDPIRSGRFFSAKTITFAVVSLAGIFPFLIYRWSTAGFAAFSLRSWPMLHAHQYWEPPGNVGLFLAEQVVWGGPLGLAAVGAIILIKRFGIRFLREHRFIVCLPLPGLVVQGLLGLFGSADQDVLAALWLPWLFLVGVIVVRLLDQGARARVAILALILASGLQTLTGFFPATAEWWGGRFAPQRHRAEDNIAAEVARCQTETGASFLVTDSPRDASLLSFYLPLQAFVYVVPHEGIHSQYDLWSNYFDFGGASGLYLSRSRLEPPQEIKREFAEVKKLRDVSLSDQAVWRLFACVHYGASADEAK